MKHTRSTSALCSDDVTTSEVKNSLFKRETIDSNASDPALGHILTENGTTNIISLDLANHILDEEIERKLFIDSVSRLRISRTFTKSNQISGNGFYVM